MVLLLELDVQIGTYNYLVGDLKKIKLYAFYQRGHRGFLCSIKLM